MIDYPVKIVSRLKLLFRHLALVQGKNLDTNGLSRSFHVLQSEMEFADKHRSGVAQIQSMSRQDAPFKLNLGCGQKTKTGWLNIDVAPQADIALDLREELPFSDGSCEIIYSEHFLEHMDYPEDVGRFLAECHRVLRVGGVFSVGVPDGEVALNAYAGQDAIDFFRISKERWHPDWAETRMEQINYLFRQGSEHKFIYDYETMSKALVVAGFQNVRRREFDPSLDSEDRAWGTLYVDADR